jgi:hypothetical protein
MTDIAITFAPPPDTLINDERLAELAGILAAGIDRSNPRQIKENSPNLGDSSLDILALKRRRGQQLRTRVGDVE